MKKILFFLCAIFAWNTSAQEHVDFDVRLLYRYDRAQLEDFSQNHTSKFNYLNFYVKNAFYLEDAAWLPEEKRMQYPDIFDFLSIRESYVLEGEITPENINIFMFDLKFKETQRNTYRFGNSNTLVVLRSMNEIYDLFNQSNVR